VVAAGAVAGGALALAQLAPSVASLGQWVPLRRAGRCTWRGQGDAVALTFDDGPSPEATPVLLDRLDELGLRATFFCLGEAVDRHPGLVRATVARGHQVETHGYRHRHHLGATPRWIGRDLDRSLAALGAVGVTPRWFRPPYGQVSTGTVLAARRRGLRLALWSAWGREWDRPDAAAVVDQVGRGLAPGAVILLHDSDMSSPAGSARRALDALGPLAEDLGGRGLASRTLDQLTGSGVGR
jgi:peptidoglycan-N-acetylglucosamine deacetylase